jgi:hypothetical protein
MDPEALHLARETSEMFSWVSEAFCFIYIGLTSVKFWLEDSASLTCILGYLFGILLARILVVVVLSGLLSLGVPASQRLDRSELTVVCLGGSLRGVIAYALVLEAVPNEFEKRTISDQIMVTTTLGVVWAHTLFGGVVFPIALRFVRTRPQVADGGEPSLERQQSLLSNGHSSVSEERMIGTVGPPWFQRVECRLFEFDEAYLQPTFGRAISRINSPQSGRSQHTNGVIAMTPMSSCSVGPMDSTVLHNPH